MKAQKHIPALWAGILAAASMQAETLELTAPTALPRGCPLVGYSPVVQLHYSGLNAEAYTLKVWLLETRHYYAASTQWTERTLPLDHAKGGASEGELLLNPDMDVFDYSSFLWVARMYNAAGVEVASSQVKARGLAAEPALLRPVGPRIAIVHQPLRVALGVRASDIAATFRVLNAPQGATIDPKTGVFTWTPASSGAVTVVFEAVTGDTNVADAEIVTIRVSAPVSEK